MLNKMYTVPLLAGMLALAFVAHADEPNSNKPDAAAQAARDAAQTARTAAQTARADAEAARTQAESARTDAQRQLEQMRGQMRELSRKMADLSIKLGDVGPRTYAFRYLGDPDRGMIGVVLSPGKDGLRVDAVTPGGPADKAGVHAGDVLTAIDGKKLAGEDAGDALHDLKIGQGVKLAILHDGKSREVALKAERREPFVFSDAFGKGGLLPPDFDHQIQVKVHDAMRHANGGMHELHLMTPWWGLNLATLNPDLGGYFGTDKGVLVIAADNDSLPGIKAGDVITNIAGETVNRPEDALRALRDQESGKDVAIKLLRDRKTLALNMKAPAFNSIFDMRMPPPPPAPPALPAPAAVPAPPAPAAPPTPPTPPAIADADID